jgi:hypothetical protein
MRLLTSTCFTYRQSSIIARLANRLARSSSLNTNGLSAPHNPAKGSIEKVHSDVWTAPRTISSLKGLPYAVVKGTDASQPALRAAPGLVTDVVAVHWPIYRSSESHRWKSTVVKDGKSRSGSRRRGWPEARAPDWQGPRSLRPYFLKVYRLSPEKFEAYPPHHPTYNGPEVAGMRKTLEHCSRAPVTVSPCAAKLAAA